MTPFYPARLVAEALLELPEAEKKLFQWVTTHSPGHAVSSPDVTIWSRAIDKTHLVVILRIERGHEPDAEEDLPYFI